jgi:16S rRNA processing protein RimM
VHGLRGALRFRPDNPDSESIGELKRIFLEQHGEQSEHRVVDTSPAYRGIHRIALERIATVTDAEALKGAVVFAREDELPPPEEDEFYYHQAVGCEVVLTDGTSIGTIEEVFATGANDVFVVRGNGREVLVPVIEDVVKEIDPEARRVTIEAVPGLLE